jgi:hypothetical protein
MNQMNRQRKRHREPRKNSRSQAPRSLEEAFAQGWTVHEQLASWQFNGSNRREGFLMLGKGGPGETRTLMVRHLALYELGEPYFVEARLRKKGKP